MVASQVQHDGAVVRHHPIGISNPLERGMQADRRIMDDVFRSRCITDEEPSEAHHFAIVTLVDRARVGRDPILDVTADVGLRRRHHALHTTTDTARAGKVDRRRISPAPDTRSGSDPQRQQADSRPPGATMQFQKSPPQNVR